MSHMARHGRRPPDWLSGARSALSLLHFFLVFSRSAPDLQYECLDCRPNKTSANLRSRIPEHNFPIFLVLLKNQCKYHCPLLHCSWRYYRGWQNTSDKLEGFGSFFDPQVVRRLQGKLKILTSEMHVIEHYFAEHLKSASLNSQKWKRNVILY